jgi:N-acetylglutamate synthase-like GNAT family acetyltransferase
VARKTTKIDEHLVRTIRMAKPSDLTFVSDLQTRWSNNIGFLPRAALQQAIESNRTLLVFENGQHAGYLNWSANRKGAVHVTQVAIEPELLRTTLGTKIMRTIERSAVKGGCSIIRLASRSNLTANFFWPELGFATTAVFQRNSRRGLPLIEWTKLLVKPTDAVHSILRNGKGYRKSQNSKLHLPDLSMVPTE